MLTDIRIVLINTSHPGNIGSAARAMKTMGLSELVLVGPKQFPDQKAFELASGATDVLDHAKVVATIDEAIADCQLVIGTSSRSRAIPWPLLTARELGEKVAQETHLKTAILFGNEQSGLSNEELHLCHYHVQVPTNPIYSSLNLASAVQIIAYECRVASLDQVPPTPMDYQKASMNEMNGFYQQLQETLIELDFLKASAPRQLMARLKRLFNRARPDVMEINILRGILTAVRRRSD